MGPEMTRYKLRMRQDRFMKIDIGSYAGDMIFIERPKHSDNSLGAIFAKGD
jgi:hypothetical protein